MSIPSNMKSIETKWKICGTTQSLLRSDLPVKLSNRTRRAIVRKGSKRPAIQHWNGNYPDVKKSLWHFTDWASLVERLEKGSCLEFSRKNVKPSERNFLYIKNQNPGEYIFSKGIFGTMQNVVTQDSHPFNKSPYMPSASLTLLCSSIAKLASLKKSICWTEGERKCNIWELCSRTDSYHLGNRVTARPFVLNFLITVIMCN